MLVHPHIEEANPYLGLLAGALVAHGVESCAFSWRRLAREQIDVLHVHWPELAVGPRAAWKAVVATVAFVGTVTLARWRGAAVVWTVHNLGSHESWHPRLEQALMRWWIGRVDGLITLSDWARGRVAARYPHVSSLPTTTVGHGTYPVDDPPSREDARRRLGIEPTARVALHFGHLRPYKGTDYLIEQFARTSLDATLLVRGRARPPAFGDLIARIAQGNERVRIELSQATTEELWRLLVAADVVVLPYRDVAHAGSVLLALSAGKPTVTTASGAMPELQAEVGSEWIRLLDVDYGPNELERAILEPSAPPPAAPPAMPSQDWTNIATRTRALYDEARSSAQSRRGRHLSWRRSDRSPSARRGRRSLRGPLRR